jgi:hypothetical protein
MTILKRNAFASVPRKTVELEVPEMGGSIRLREMSGTERDQFEVAAFREGADGKQKVDPMFLRARLVASCLVDDKDNRLYRADEIEQLSNDLPAGILARLFEAAQKLNGVDSKAVENAEKNSAAAPQGASTSA